MCWQQSSLLVLAGPWIAIAHAGAAKLAVLELRNDAGLSAAEIAYLTDRVRGDASQALPSSAFLVMTRESIQDLLPPGVRLVDCLSSRMRGRGRPQDRRRLHRDR